MPQKNEENPSYSNKSQSPREIIPEQDALVLSEERDKKVEIPSFVLGNERLYAAREKRLKEMAEHEREFDKLHREMSQRFTKKSNFYEDHVNEHYQHLDPKIISRCTKLVVKKGQNLMDQKIEKQKSLERLVRE